MQGTWHCIAPFPDGGARLHPPALHGSSGPRGARPWCMTASRQQLHAPVSVAHGSGLFTVPVDHWPPHNG